MPDPLKSVSTRATPQSEPATAAQVRNSAGGFVFQIDDAQRLRRFLTLGVEGGTYYASARALARRNAEVVVRLAQTDPRGLVDAIVRVSAEGRAPKQGPGLFALAVAASLADADGRRYALGRLGEVARTGTALFQFAGYAQQFRSWGRSLRRAVGSWYLDKTVDELAYQLVKYRQRDGWTHRDLLRLAHPGGAEPGRAALFDWACGREVAPQRLPGLVGAHQRLAAVEAGPSRGSGRKAVRAAVEILEDQPGLPWEALPDWALNSADVWEVLLRQGVPQTALLRQLPRLTRLGLATGRTGKAIAAQLADPERLRRARVHPVNVLVALRTYASGHGARGDQAWNPSRVVVGALDSAFYAAYGAVEPTGKRLCLALDVSGSMVSRVSGLPISAREASAAMALVTAAVEDDHEVVGFTGRADAAGFGLGRLAISPRQRLDDAIKKVSGIPFGPTDCGLPMLWAAHDGLEFDAFVVYTDNETWHGDVHPFQALRRYREKSGIDAKLVVVAATATDFSIADPSDPGMLDVAGFDSAAPNLIGDFIRGGF